MFFRSIKVRLTIWHVLILGVILASFSIFLYLTLADNLHTGLDSKIRATAEVIASSYARSLRGSPSLADIERIMREHFGIRPLGRFIQVLDESGRVGEKSTNLKNVELPVSVKTLQEASQGKVIFETIDVPGDYPLRLVTFPIIVQKRMIGVVQVGSSLEGVTEALRQLLIILVIAVPAALLLTSLAGYFLANKALQPVDEITQTARRIGSGDLSQRISIRNVNDEIGRLASTFNDMIARLNASFEQMKRFTADASHELKTPLTVLKGEVEVGLQRKRQLDEYRRILTSNLEEINRMTRLVEDLLVLSRADMGDFPIEQSPVDVTHVAQGVWEDLLLLARDKGVDLRFVGDGTTRVIGDSLRLRQLFLNLVENGIKYTAPGGEVEVRVRRDDVDGMATIDVVDSGIGIETQYLSRVFDRFFRVDKARSRDTGGTGLGLSICRSIVEAHRGEISVTSTPGKGSIFRVKIPLEH
jgi:heavy metal sensor kinase